MTATILEPKTNPEYEKLVPALTPSEYQALKESISSEGLIYPILVNRQGIVLDGHHRLRACRELGIRLTEQNMVVKDFGAPLEEGRFVITANLRRRHLNDFQKAELGYALLQIEREKARLRQLSTLKQGDKLPSTSIKANGEDTGKAAVIVAKEVGLSRPTFERSISIIERAPERLKEKLRAGEISIAAGYETTKAIQLLQPDNLRDKVGPDRAEQLAKLNDSKLQDMAADEVIDNSLSTQEVETLVSGLMDGKTLNQAVNRILSDRLDEQTKRNRQKMRGAVLVLCKTCGERVPVVLKCMEKGKHSVRVLRSGERK